MSKCAAMAAVLAAATLPFLPWNAYAQPRSPTPLTAADLPRLTAELAAVTAHAQQLTEALNRAAARDGGLRVAYARLDDTHHAAQSALDSRARQVYMAAAPSPVGNWQADLAAPDLRELAHRGEREALVVDRDLVDAVTAQSAQLRKAQRQADAFRARLLVQAREVLADQDRARGLLAQAQVLVAAERARAQASAQAAEVERLLESQRALLDDVSATVTLALTPAQTVRTRRAAADQAPLVARLEAAGSAVPAGYALSGTQFSGTASWYGPGFVGRPTASGAPYDPERPTCAHKTLPLGTVVHVSANGLETNCLVNDRGPYVGDRVLDLSRAGSRSLGYDGLAQVVVEVLVPLS